MLFKKALHVLPVYKSIAPIVNSLVSLFIVKLLVGLHPLSQVLNLPIECYLSV
jgi:hypothetical protein